ncbi:MAG: hypothetical protein JKY99_08385, partial [Rhizobiales bacterium]|nr:hypothetical protein [Hyphomicrobiales bacterium]
MASKTPANSNRHSSESETTDGKGQSMGGLQKQHFIAAAIATALVVNFAYFGGIKMLGAHPWWASKVGYIGAGVGAIVWFALSIAKLNHKTIL